MLFATYAIYHIQLHLKSIKNLEITDIYHVPALFVSLALYTVFSSLTVIHTPCEDLPQL